MRIRKRIEEPFGWIKTIGGGRKLRYIGRQRNRAWFKITAAVYNLIRITALDANQPEGRNRSPAPKTTGRNSKTQQGRTPGAPPQHLHPAAPTSSRAFQQPANRSTPRRTGPR